MTEVGVSFFAAFFMGMVAALLAFIIIQNTTKVNISDEELYRFCIVRKIPLEDCKIPPLNLPDRKATPQ